MTLPSFRLDLGAFILGALKMVLLLGFVNVCLGQSDENRKSVYVELAGSGGLGSLNFEKQFKSIKSTELTWRAGISLAPIDKNNGTGIVFPVLINALVGKGSHKFEVGAGQGITFTTKGRFFALTTAVVGYRYQPFDKRWFYRVSYTPLISYLVDFQYQHWGGVSVGYTINKKRR